MAQLGSLVWGAMRFVDPQARRQAAFIRQTLAASPRPRDVRAIVSLTTLPDRIANLRPTLRSLLRQTRLPDEILLALPRFSRRQQRAYSIPAFLRHWPRLRIIESERDWGPATKFIPAIQHELAAGRGDTSMMVVDDDRAYPPEALETYLHYSNELPNAALCFRGARMPASLDWKDSRMTFGNQLREPERTAVITGCGSYFIKPRFLDERLWDYSDAPPGAFYMDDIWISGWLDRRAVEKYVVPAASMMLTVLRQRRTMTLHDVPGGRVQSNNEAIAFFSSTWNVFAPPDG